MVQPNQQITSFLKYKLPSIKGIYLFGSYADGTANSESDVDIAFLLEKPEKLDSYFLFSLADELGSLLTRDVDLVDLQNTSIDFRFVIISCGKRIFCSDKAFCDTFEMTTYSMYLRFEEERKPIIEDIKKRGRIYG